MCQTTSSNYINNNTYIAYIVRFLCEYDLRLLCAIRKYSKSERNYTSQWRHGGRGGEVSPKQTDRQASNKKKRKKSSHTTTSRAESEKGINAVQQCSVRNQKGVIAIDFVQRMRPSGSQRNIVGAALAPFWLSTDENVICSSACMFIADEQN